MNRNEFDDLLASKCTIDREFQKRVLNTQYDVLGVSTPTLRELAKCEEILNYNFLDDEITSSYEKVFLYFASNLYKLEKDLNGQIAFIFNNIKYIDTWALTDTLYLYLKKATIETSSVFLKSEEVFLRRIGYVLLIKFSKDIKNTDYIFSTIDNDDRYYVYMAEAWLLSYCLIYDFEKTCNFIKNSDILVETKMKGIQKAIESRRVSDENKEKLRNLKKELSFARF